MLSINSITFNTPTVTKGFDEALHDGYYSARIVGILEEEIPYGDSKGHKFSFLLQVLNDNKKVIYKRSNKFTSFSLSENANFARMMCAVFQCDKDPSVLESVLRKHKIIDHVGHLVFDNLLNLPVTIAVEGYYAKNNSDKRYYRIISISHVTEDCPELPLNIVRRVPKFLRNEGSGKLLGYVLNKNLHWSDEENVHVSSEDNTDDYFML